MASYPQTMDFIGLNQPVAQDVSLKRLVVEGKIPADIRGAFFRAVPDPAFPPKFEDDNVLSGDGMISKLHFKDDGGVDFDMRFVQTARHQAEVKAGRALFGRYRNPFTDDPAVEGVDRTVANTTPVFHAGKLLMTKEDGRPYRIDPHSLETLGSYDFDGVLKSETMTAHVRIDPVTHEMFFFGYEANGLASTKVAYCIADKDGKLVSEQWFDAPYCSLMHDFVVTEHYAVFPVLPTTADFDRLKAGGEHWVHHLELDSWVGVVPRYGKVEEMRWFKGPKGVSVFHMLNAFETPDGCLHIDQGVSSANNFPFIQRASGHNFPPGSARGGMMRWSMDMKGQGTDVVTAQIGPPGDMPRITDADQGRPYTRGWYCTVNPQMKGPPVIGGPVGPMFNMLFRINPETGELDALTFPPAHSISEPVHIVSAQPGHGGWLVLIVDHQTGENDFTHAAWVVAADDISAGPVAKVRIPHRLRPQVHGWWVGAEALAQAA